MKDFIRFVGSAILVLIIVFFVDNTLGPILNKVGSKHADIKFAIAENNRADVALIGASVTYNQYNSSILSDTLQMSVYNYGRGGSNIYTTYCMAHYLIEKSPTPPRIIIYNPCHIDLMDSPGWNTEKLGELTFGYHTDSVIHDVVNMQGIKKKVEYNLLNLYSHNSNVFRYVKNIVHKNYIDANNGYSPLYAEWSEPIEESPHSIYELDDCKINYFERLYSLCKENNILFCISIAPSFMHFSEEPKWVSYIKEFSYNNNVIFLDYTGQEYYINHPELYYNPMHLNSTGATHFSKEFAHELKNILK